MTDDVDSEGEEENERPEVCLFCGRTVDDDPRWLDMFVRHSVTSMSQRFTSHFECLRAAMHTDVQGVLIDLSGLPDDTS